MPTAVRRGAIAQIAGYGCRCKDKERKLSHHGLAVAEAATAVPFMIPSLPGDTLAATFQAV
ncbi:MAG: hypothetical protein EOO27_21830 [Comamonadaceae bacterium]|nr:MAG: hypothetical protein EOO27_21830 [Comamonadaceae bacterium]